MIKANKCAINVQNNKSMHPVILFKDVQVLRMHFRESAGGSAEIERRNSSYFNDGWRK